VLSVAALLLQLTLCGLIVVITLVLMVMGVVASARARSVRSCTLLLTGVTWWMVFITSS
jgi:hypothetical protein